MQMSLGNEYILANEPGFGPYKKNFFSFSNDTWIEKGFKSSALGYPYCAFNLEISLA